MDEELRSRLQQIEKRLERLEAVAGLVSKPTEAFEKPTYDYSAPPVVIPPPLQATDRVDSPPSKAVRDLEYEIGAKVGPIVGAIAVLAAIGYFVSLALTRGWISPWMIFGVACAVCGAFIGVGLWKREEREEFGQVLIGIGSCGLYLNFAAGHVYQKLYSGEVLVGLFVALSLINLTYALWRASKVFLSIGLLGGLAAAAMPLTESKDATSILLTLLIVAPTMAIAGRCRWPKAVGAAWLASMSLLLVVATVNIGNSLLSAFYLTGLLATVALIWADVDLQRFDSKRLSVPLLIFLTGLIDFPHRPTPEGAVYVIGFGLAAAVVGLAFRDRTHGLPAVAGGAAVALLLAPFGWDHGTTMAIFLVESLLLATASLRCLQKPLSILSGLALTLAIWTYGVSYPVANLAPMHEARLLMIFIGATVLQTYAAVKAWGNTESLVIGSSIILLAPIVRVVQLAVTPAFEGSIGSGVVSGFLFAGTVLLGVAVALRSQRASVIAAGAVFCGLVVYAATMPERGSLADLDALVVSLYALTFGVGAIALSGTFPTEKPSLYGISAFIVGLLVVRLGTILLSPSVPPATAVLFTGSAYLLLIGLLSARWKVPGVPHAGGILWVLMAVLHSQLLSDGVEFGDWEPWALILLLSAVPVLMVALEKQERRFVPAYGYVSSLGTVYVMSRLGWLWLGPEGMGLNGNAAITTAWIATALALLTVGFLREVPSLRLSAFGILFATMLKLVFVDLANTDQAIKVLILMLFGLVMLGGGYWYIRREKRLTPPPAT